MSEFENYLTDKKIHSKNFREAEPNIWEEWKVLFEQIHPESFTAQKLFLINNVRRRYPLSMTEKTSE